MAIAHPPPPLQQATNLIVTIGSETHPVTSDPSAGSINLLSLVSTSFLPNFAGVWGESEQFEGVHGVSHTGFAGVGGVNMSAQGGSGVWGASNNGIGVVGTVGGVNPGAHGAVGVWGASNNGIGVVGISQVQAPGVFGAPGVWGESQKWGGVVGKSHADAAIPAGANQTTINTDYARTAGVAGTNDSTGPGVYGENTTGQGPAGYFVGDVKVTGDVQLVGGDCAEQFDVIDASACEPGTVVVIDDAGTLIPSYQEYDRRVAGVVSGAGDLRPGLVLGHHAAAPGRLPVALIGKVFCKVDAGVAPIEIGDLLTTSSRTGHAMKASDAVKAFGSVIGKALQPMAHGRGLILILIALQ